jgi:iron complex outermembrane recepter protein
LPAFAGVSIAFARENRLPKLQPLRALFVLLAAMPLLAGAQTTAPAPQPAASQPEGGLQQVVVTAQRRAQPLQQVGVAVTVLSGDELAARGVRRVNQLQNEVPNLEIEPAFGGGQAQFRLRGVGFQDYATNNSGTVTVYVDEVAYPLPVQTQGLLFDLDRVEVLRGPQGTLYGRNTTGGAVNFITRKPTSTFEGSAMLGFGSFGAVEAEAYLSGPFSETLRGRVSLATQQGGGWQRHRDTGEELGDKDVVGVRGQLELDATRDLRFALSLRHGTDQSDGQGLYAFVEQPAVPGYPVPKPALPADKDRRNTGWGFSPAFLAQIGQPADAKPSRDNDATSAALTVNWDLGALRLTSISGVDRFDRKELADFDATSLPLAETYFDSSARNFSQELRLATNTPEAAFNWLAGLYYADEELDEAYWSSFENSFGFATVRTTYEQKVRIASVFGQADYRFAPDFKLVVGLRQERERRERNRFVTESIGPDITFTGPTSGRFTNNETSGKLALEYQASRDLLAYGSISRGVKSGGFTAYNTFNETALTPFKPEVLIAYEAGFKSDLSRRLRLNAAVFHYDYRDQQILDAIVDPGTGATVGKIVNAPKSTINGVELELAWKPTNALTVTQFLGYKHGEFKEYQALNPPPGADLSGESLYFPRLSYGGAVSYRFAAAGVAFNAQADASYRDRSRSFLNRINPQFDFDVPGYWLANARLDLAPIDSRWSASVFVRNLFDKEYDLTRNFFDLPLPVAAAGPPRAFGVQARYEF